MFNKEIEFSAHEDYFAQKEDYPTPIKLNIPEWYKKLEYNLKSITVKGCMPFLDTLTAGYLLKTPQDFHLSHNVDSINKEGEKFKDAFQNLGFNNRSPMLSAKYINLNCGVDVHPIHQLEGSPLVEKNKNLPFHKIINPWKIKTPKGYSCLFVPPLNNHDDRFSILPGIVDTDTFPREINFPIIINGDKYPVLESMVEKGTPYAQVIPFKREAWKMSLKPRSQKEVQNSILFYTLKIINIYKTKYWHKKTWK